MKAAARTYIMHVAFRSHTWVSVLAYLAIIASGLFILTAKNFDFFTGLWAGIIVIAVAFFVMIWLAHSRSMRTKIEQMNEPVATFELSDECLSIETDNGSSRLPWTTMKEIWRGKLAWLLRTRGNQTITVPLRGVPDEALAFLAAKISPARS